ncbi:MAG TPA: alpha/beta hydrolase domain-containing protein [Thermoanaerobaculia bacterium]
MFIRVLALCLLVVTPLSARVVRVDVTSRADLAFGYERIDAKVFFEVDPANPHNRRIADLDRADSQIFSADLVLLRPKCGGNDVLHLEIPNRGGLGRSSNAGVDDFLFRRGYTIGWLGWQFDVRDEPGRLRLYPPVVRGLRGQVRSDFIVETITEEHTIAHFIGGAIGGKGYPVADRADRKNVLTERDDVTAARRVIPRKRWRFTSDSTIALEDGFQPGRIYEIVYTAADPAVVGTGFAAVRDLVSYLKYDEQAIASVKTAYGFGISQSGRFLRHLVYEGFNADEEGRQVFDGLLVHVAGAGRGNFNHRFAQPSRDAQPIVPAFYPVDVFPFTDLPTTDPVSGRTAGLLDLATADGVVPKIIYMNTGYEYWSRGAALIHTTPDGRADVEPAPTSRIYVLSGHGHIGGPFPPQRPVNAQNLQNFLNYWPLTHALVDALDAWVRHSTEPPPSRYPRISDGTLVPAETLTNAPRFAYQPFRIDTTTEPPRISGTYTALVPMSDGDGIEIAGVRMPFHSVPLAAFTSWNLRTPSAGFPQYRASFLGSILPFPGPVIEARYRSHDEYIGRFTGETMKLIEGRYLVPEDLHGLVTRGTELWNWVMQRE